MGYARARQVCADAGYPLVRAEGFPAPDREVGLALGLTRGARGVDEAAAALYEAMADEQLRLHTATGHLLSDLDCRCLADLLRGLTSEQAAL